MRTMVVGLAILGVALLVSMGTAQDAKDKPKHTIKEVMKVAHKGGLLKKVTGGQASKEEQKELAELYKSLSQNKPPMGDVEVWKKNTARMVALAEAVVNGDDKAAKTLAKTVQ